MGSDMLLCRMFFNLVENAVKYNHPGGTVKVDVQQQDGQVVIHVADTGRGIPQEFWQSIFQPFSAWTSPSAASLAERGLASAGVGDRAASRRPSLGGEKH